MNILKLWRGSGKVVARRTGPLVSVFLFFLFLFFTYYVYIFIGLINVWRDWQDGTKKKTDPKDVFRIVYAISKFFFYPFFYTY